MKPLSIVITSFNTQELTLNCLDSIRNQNLFNKNGSLQVILVDNGSEDGTVPEVHKKYPWVDVIVNTQNLGFAAANNQGIIKAKGKVILLLNSDTLVQDNTLEKMLRFLNEKKDAAAATPKLQLPDGSLDLACHRGFPTPWNAFSYLVGLERLFPEVQLFSGYHQTWKDFNVTHEVDAISGACFFIKKQVIEEVGLLDENFFMYGEDLDWCLRIKQKGWKIYYNPETSVFHLKKQSGRNKIFTAAEKKAVLELRVNTTKHFFETMKLFYAKHYAKKYPRWVKNLVLTGIRILIGIKLLHNRRNNKI